MGIEKNWNIRIGCMERGERNKISDVAGVTVGHCTLCDGSVQTGVTALLPHAGDLFHDKVMAACHVINGFGKSVGLLQIEELGSIETPILLTNTLSVGTASQALVEYMLEKNSDIGATTGSVNPIVCECNDGELNDLRGLHVRGEHVRYALSHCAAEFAEGAVGAGRGMRCHEMKGGIGSSSRTFLLDGREYTLGALLLTNHALARDLIIAGTPVGHMLFPNDSGAEDKGSVITILATDVPLSEHQLKRLCRRTAVGLSRTGSMMCNGSGEIVLAFTTANRIPHYPERDILPCGRVRDNAMDILFRAVSEVVEESVLSSMLHAEAVTGRDGRTVPSLADRLRKSGIRFGEM